MRKIELFFPFTKIDVEKREVWGRITQEAPDKSMEIFDYDSSVPFFKAWNEEFQARTDGESVGNVREMHQASAVGKFVAMTYLDEEKAIDACAKVSDDAAWQKVLDKVYTGFSIGGGYVKKWKDGDFIRFTAKPSETSLVDNPCLGKAVFTQIIKAEGTDDPTLGELRKSMWAVEDFAGLLRQIGWMASDTASEAEWENDKSPIPAQLRNWLAQGAEIFQAMAKEELDELLATLPKGPEAEVLAMAAKLAKGELPETLVKAEDLQAALEKAAATQADLAKATETITAHMARIAELEAQPAPPKGVITGNTVVSKSEDAEADLQKQAESISKLTPEEQARLLIKVVHSVGGAIR